MLSIEGKQKVEELKTFLKDSENFADETLKKLELTRSQLNLINNTPGENKKLN